MASCPRSAVQMWTIKRCRRNSWMECKVPNFHLNRRLTILAAPSLS